MKATRDATRDVALFERVASALAAHSDTSQALEEILGVLETGFAVAASWIWLLDHETSRFFLAASRGLPPLLQEPMEMTGEPCWCIEAFVDGDFVSKNVRVIDCSRLRRAEHDPTPDRTGGLRYHASVVLRFGARQLGILNLSRADWQPLGTDDLAVLSALGSQIGLALERARLAREANAAARTDERMRLARDIHDTLAQEFAAIALQLEAALRVLQRDPALARERIDAALGVAQRSIDAVRETMTNLRSDPLGGRALGTALAALVRAFASEHGIVVGFSDDTTRALPYHVEVELYRVATEALENVRKHARAHRAWLRLREERDAITLAIADDGVGRDLAAVADGRFGIVGMRERLASLGGSLDVRANDGGFGTLVCARVDLAR